MHVRVVRTRSNGKAREYAQLVQSYRRKSDGMPMQRVVASLGHPDDPLVENMRQCLAAARDGKRVGLVRQSAQRSVAKPTANLRYLDVAVMLELWREWGFDALLDEVLPQGDELVRPACIVAALTVQRCVDPGSKLYATRWLPRTSLVELLAVTPVSFNNSRLHRVLDELDSATPRLMAKLPSRYEQREGTFASLFMDVTDTWFVGRGCELAENGKTKEGMVKRKIGIVLLCNEHGYPLRWEVITGTQHDSGPMTQMMKAVAGFDWVGEAPIVCDRAMGHTAHLREMAQSGVRFLTALTESEFERYAHGLPHQALSAIRPTDIATRAEDVRHAAEAAKGAGMEPVSDDLLVMDVGIVEGTEPAPQPDVEARDASDGANEPMRLCRQINELVAQGRYASYAAAGRSLGLGKGVVAKYRQLGSLSEQQQCEILDGKLAGASLGALLRLAKIASGDERERAFEALKSAARTAPRVAPAPARRKVSAESSSQGPLRLRVAAYFNPERFVDERLRAQERLAGIEAFVAELNAKLALPRARLTKRRVDALIDRRLSKESLVDAFDVRIAETKVDGRDRLRVELALKPAEWARRRRYDGFTVLVAHPELPHSAIDMCRLYREKDAVEKDFQVIKSVVEVRPVWHHTVAKVRAHVTLCMLALLLERTLHRRLRATRYSSRQAMEILQACQMNMYATPGQPSAYTITQPDAEQSTILRALRMVSLADDDVLAARMTPR